MIRNWILVGGKKYEVTAWIKEMKGKGKATAPPEAAGGQGTTRALLGRWKAGPPNTTTAQQAQGGTRPQFPAPMEPAAMRRSGHAQGGETMTNVGTGSIATGTLRWRMLSNVRCYQCGLMGHLQYTWTSPSRKAAAGVENGWGILPVPTHMKANQNGKRPAAEIPQETQMPAIGDGAKYKKPYWLARLKKVRE